MWEETGDEAKAQGWAPVVIDTNGNGKLDDYVQPNQAVDPTKDKRLNAGLYGVGVEPGRWVGLGRRCSDIRRYVAVGANPRRPSCRKSTSRRSRASGRAASTSTAMASPMCRCRAAISAASTAASAKARSTARRPPTGKLCPEGWTLYPFPGPQFSDVAESGSAEASYYTWVDQHNTLGLGNNVPLATGNVNELCWRWWTASGSTCAFPIRMGFLPRGSTAASTIRMAAGRAAALWSTYGNRTPFHRETGKGTLPKLSRFQIRPDPLAR